MQQLQVFADHVHVHVREPRTSQLRAGHLRVSVQIGLRPIPFGDPQEPNRTLRAIKAPRLDQAVQGPRDVQDGSRAARLTSIGHL